MTQPSDHVEAMTIRRAAEVLRAGGVVALPTETVYGLGADASNEAAVRRIFEIKGRPATNPLIVHVADASSARRCVSHWPDGAQRLAERFWPGPLTIVLPKSEAIAPAVTAGGPTVGVRVPAHPVALSLLRAFAELGGNGLAAPSANRSNHVSPTTAQHVRDDLGDAVDLVLDGGPCRVGIESTVLSLADSIPTVLRPGGVSVEALREVLGDVAVVGGSDTGASASPGRQAVHYKPNVEVELFEPAGLSSLERAGREQGWDRLVVMPLAQGEAERRVRQWSREGAATIPMPGEPAAYARGLYGALREAERRGARLFIELPPDEPGWRAVRDRLLRMGSVGRA